MRKVKLASLLLCAIAAPAAEDSMPASLVAAEWLREHRSDPSVVLIHVSRGSQDADGGGHIPGARDLRFSDIAVSTAGVPNEMPAPEQLVRAFELAEVRPGSRVLLYDQDGGMLAARAWIALRYIGFQNAALVDGGLARWQAAGGGEVVRHEWPVAPLVAKPDNGIVISFEQARSLLADNNVVFVDSRPPEEFSGVRPGEGVKRGGHIPGAVNIFWKRHLVSDADPVLKPAAELRALFERAGVTRDKKVVAYCRTGVQASHTYFVLRSLGYDVVLYDGSFIEWSAKADAPVEK